jgi:hypothetical protein
MPFSYLAVPRRVYVVFFLFDLNSAAVLDSHIPIRARPVLKAVSQGHGTARHGSDMDME